MILAGNLPGNLDFALILSLGVFVLFRHQTPDMQFDLIPIYVVPTYFLLHFHARARLRVAQAKAAETE